MTRTYLEIELVIKMKNIISILALAFIVSMVTASGGEITITSPVPGQKYYVWDEVPIRFTSTLGEGYSYTTYVNGVETDVFAPEDGGRHVVKVFAENPGCLDCYDKQRQIAFDVGYFPRVNKTRIVIMSPKIGVQYHVNDSIPIEFETPLLGRDDFVFKTYVTGPDGVRKMTENWEPTIPGKYGIKVDAIGIGNGFHFSSSAGYVAQEVEQEG